ncbi:MAG: hypothetical protein HPY61_12785 [Methanotrichaceae archaeon]|nr:hypothetical protein [Methanotrichaceae archaeon]
MSKDVLKMKWLKIFQGSSLNVDDRGRAEIEGSRAIQPVILVSDGSVPGD